MTPATTRTGAGSPLWRPVAAGLGGAGVVASLGLSDPYRPGRHLACPVLAFTGFYCLACGGQRAVHDLARLDLAGAWDMNPVVVLGAPVVLVLWVWWLRGAWSLAGRSVGPVGGRPPGRTAGPPAGGQGPHRALPVPRPLVAWTVLAVLAAFTVLRNVPALGPWLAP